MNHKHIVAWLGAMLLAGVAGAGLNETIRTQPVLRAANELASDQWSRHAQVDRINAAVVEYRLAEPVDVRSVVIDPNDTAPETSLALANARIQDLVKANTFLAGEVRAAETARALERLEGPNGPIGSWMEFLPAADLPATEDLVLMSEYMRDYPVTLAPYEGAWLFERMAKEDWLDWGPTIDEAIILYLGPERLRQELTPEQFVALASEWEEEGYFRQ